MPTIPVFTHQSERFSSSLQIRLITMRNLWLHLSANALFEGCGCDRGAGQRLSRPFNFLPHR